MDKTILVGLTGHANRFRLDADAYDRLARYLDRATARLRHDPDQAEVLGDLERSVGDKLTALVGASDRLVTSADIDGVLAAIGSVETDQPAEPDERTATPPKRRLQRIRDGQMVAGVCTGLAAYAEIRVDWVRSLFVIGTVFSAGILAVVYVALAFLLPIAATREA